MPNRPTGIVLILLSACLLTPTRAGAEPDLPPARAAADGVLAKLPPPSPAVHIDYEGDLVVGGLWAGETRYTARGAKVGRQAVWRVTQDTYIDHAGEETRIRVLVHLKPDLSVLSGTYERKEKSGTLSAAFSRSSKGLLVQRSRAKAKAESKSEVAEVEVAARATTSVGALLLFLRAAAGTKGTRYDLPWLSLRSLESDPMKVDDPVLQLVVAGARSWGDGKQRRKAWAVEVAHGAKRHALYLTPDRKTLIGTRSPELTGLRLPAGTQGEVVPRGEGGERLTVKPDEPAATWKEAFLKFGFGYHLPRASLLEAAFHWQDMYEYETKVSKRWDAKRPLEEFKQAWIDEFVAQSKNRSVQDARRLLSMTLGTGKIKKQTKDEIVFAAHRNFGGGVQRTYYLRCRDGVWGITRIDF